MKGNWQIWIERLFFYKTNNTQKEISVKLLKYSVYMVGAALFAFSSGCVAYKPPPDIIHADNYTTESTKIQRTLPYAYKTLDVSAAINIALTNSPTYQQARLAMIQAWSVYYGSLNAFTPNVGLAFAGTQSGAYGGTPGVGGSPYGNNWTSGISGTWNVFNGLQDTMNAMSQLATAKSKEELNKDARRLLILSVKLAYYQILADKATIQIQQSNEMFQQQQVNETQLKYDAGATSLSDLLNFKVGRNNAQVSVIKAKASYAVDKYALAALLGLTTSEFPESVNFPSVDVIEDQGYSLGVDFYVNVAVDQRPDLKSSRELVKAAKYALYQTWGAFAPTAGLNWSYTSASSSPNPVPSSGGSNQPYFNPTYTNSYGFSTAWTLWDGGSQSSRIMKVRGAQANYDSTQEGLLSSWITVVKSVRTSYMNLTSAIAQKKINGATLSMSKERRDLVRDEYNAGNTDIATLNQAQNDLVGVEQNYVTSVIGVVTNRAQLDAACGLRD